MRGYIRRAFSKLKDDFLAKALYDLLKVIFIASITALILFLFPEGNSISQFLSKSVYLTRLQLIYIVLVIIITTIFIDYFINKKRFIAIKKDLYTDELTGLPNHRALADGLAKAIEWANQKDENVLSVILMDIDDFKNLNSEVGQKVADEILVKLGGLLRSDNRITDSTYRQHFKGDEFVIVTKETALGDAAKAANRKKNNIAKTGIEVVGFAQPFQITVSCGVVEYNPAKDNAKSLLERAFNAMQEAKLVKGKNTVKSRL